MVGYKKALIILYDRTEITFFWYFQISKMLRLLSCELPRLIISPKSHPTRMLPSTVLIEASAELYT
jgi:hypothetical protein